MQNMPLLSLLKQPQIIKKFTNTDWNLTLRQADEAKMLARVDALIIDNDLQSYVPEKINHHFYSEQVRIKHLHVQVKEEVKLLNQMFAHLGITPIYLKGAAYVLAGYKLAMSRTFGDIDILVNKDQINSTEIALKCQGWVSQKNNDHDQEYYRKYMHEIPPMQNIARGTIIDIHHNILPVCTNETIDITELTAHAKLVDTAQGQQEYVLSPEAMFLHSAIHLFHEGELEQGLRGLSDLGLLFQHFNQTEDDFSQQLITLAKTINHQQSLYYAWHYLELILSRTLPNKAQLFVTAYQKNMRHAKLMDFIFTQQLIPHHSSVKTWKFSLSSTLVYWRGHLLRMPLKLLIPHLLTKTLRQLKESFKRPAVTPEHFDG